jgi:hypothetical protein
MQISSLIRKQFESYQSVVTVDVSINNAILVLHNRRIRMNVPELQGCLATEDKAARHATSASPAFQNNYLLGVHRPILGLVVIIS